MIVFADTSALGSVYLDDEADAGWLADVLYRGPDPVVVCQLADVELASLLARAHRDGRVEHATMSERLDAYVADTADDGSIGVLPVTHATFDRAKQFTLEAEVGTLDALHLAAASLLGETTNEEVSILTRDRRQAAAADALGLALYPPPGS